ncbi:MFS transporter [Nocardioides hankookensis]|uniref:MFS transporter n=1 Tax=Nocardioides hankookensis TaxID=443157 RepID=A0ABW1LMZ1_9ACTN
MLELSAPRAGRREWVALSVLALPLLLVSMDVSILYFAAPEISKDLDASPTQQLWIFDVYGFVLASLLITMGGVADRIGPRRLLLIGAVAFSATSLAAAYAESAAQLIAARALLGVAGATLMPATLSTIRTLFLDERQRGKAIGVWTGVITAGVGLGPVLSGILLAHFWWGSVFLVNIPAMLLLLAVGPVLLPRGTTRPGEGLDLVSAALSLVAVLATVYGIKAWALHGTDIRWILCIGVGLGLAVAFVRRQLRHPRPMIDPALLRNRAYRTALAGNTVCSFALIGNAVFMTGYLQLVLGYSPLDAALWSLVPTVGVACAAPFAAALGQRFGRIRVAAAGLVGGAAGFIVLLAVGTDSLLLTLVGAGVLAAGLVTALSLFGELVLGALDPMQAGAGSALSEAASELGGALGIAILGTIGAAGYKASIALPPPYAGGPASESLSGAAGVAAHLPAAASETVIEAARVAYVHGLHLAALVGTCVLLASATALLRRPTF